MTTTAPPPEAEALATAPKAIVISQFDVLLGDIKEAKEKASEAVFDYSTKAGNKEARSYVFAQRKLKSRIELARTDAKSYALAYGRKVDEQASELKGQVEALIKPHQDALDAITKAEADRVQRHRLVVDGILDLARVPFGISANELAARLETVKSVDIDGLEEFKQDAAAYRLETIRLLEAAHTKALADEAAAAELAQLREQQRIQQEKEAEDARIKAQQEAIAEAARKAQEEADAAALLAIQEAEQKVADAEARAAAAEARAADSDAVVALLEGEALLAITPAEVPVAIIPASQRSTDGPAVLWGAGVQISTEGAVVPIAAITPAHQPFLGPEPPGAAEAAEMARRRTRLKEQLQTALANMKREAVVAAIVDSRLHPAVVVDWERVS